MKEKKRLSNTIKKFLKKLKVSLKKSIKSISDEYMKYKTASRIKYIISNQSFLSFLLFIMRTLVIHINLICIIGFLIVIVISYSIINLVSGIISIFIFGIINIFIFIPREIFGIDPDIVIPMSYEDFKKQEEEESNNVK